MAEPYPIRPINDDEFAAFHAVDEQAFHGERPSPQRKRDMIDRFEFDRSLAAFDEGEPVGIAGAWSFQLSVPGAQIPAAGVSWVSVLPTHRRRGILSSIMRRQLTDIHERGEPLAILWASEAAIYGRYGYGQASWHASFTVHRGEGALRADVPADPGLRLRLTEPGMARPELGKVYEAVLPTRPGMFARNEAWWNRVLDDPEDSRKGDSPLRCLLAEDDAGPRGYALYAAKSQWDDESFLPQSTLSVREMMAADPAATALIWADLLSRDLTTTMKVGQRPADDPLLYMLADSRRSRPRITDGLWARIIDVGPALTRRRYAAPVDLVLDITDQTCPWNQGRWRLTAPAGAAGGPAAGGTAAIGGLAGSCERTTDPADVSLSAESLGAAYLGGTKLGALAGAGLAAEARPGAIAVLSAALSWDPAPWCPMIF
ncbi:MAG TPA: GNAT family N-acetyltransferase [Streptosporangiaceae bacterium]|nr:GNAT family N-acetyltransferase [Streptosporangiaceae bacterium]